MKGEPSSGTGRRYGQALATSLFLLAVYLFVYRGGFHSVDEVSMFAVTESLVKFGQYNTDQIAWTQWTTSQAEAQGFFGQDGHVYSKKGLALSLAQAPLYWLALHLPGLGMLQTVSLLNAGLTAATGSLLGLYLARLAFTPRTGLLIGLVFGLATVAFAYAKYLFSEPLAGLLLLAAAYLLLAYRQEGSWVRVTGAGLAAGLAVLARANNLFVLPVFGLYLLWVASRRAGDRVKLVVVPIFLFGLAVALVGLGLMAYNGLRSGNPLQTGYDLTLFSSQPLLGLYKLLFSPLRGLFVYSPILLLSLPGWWILRRTWPAEAWLFAGITGVTLALFSIWASGEGLSWGSRFLVPIIPFLAISLAPVVERRAKGEGLPSEMNREAQATTQREASWDATRNTFYGPHPFFGCSRFTFYVLLPLSFIIQLLGVIINPWVFLAQLQAEFGGEFFLEKTAALYDFRYSQITGQILAWAPQNSDLAWWQPWGFDGLAFGLGLAGLGVTGWLLWYQTTAVRRPPSAVLRFTLPMVTIGIIVIAYLLLARYFMTDRQFGPPEDGYTQALNAVAAQAGPADRLVTVAPYHYHVPMNRFKARVPLLGLARQGEPPPETVLPLLAGVTTGRNAWLVTVGLQPATPDNLAERWLALNAFKASDTWFPDEVRLVRYGLGQPAAGREIGAILDGRILLRKALFTEGPLSPGQALVVELTWQPLTPLPADYTLFMQLLAADGHLVAQVDGPPNGGYTTTSTWQPGWRVVTRQALIAPPELTGELYHLIAGLYDPATGQRLEVDHGGDFVELGTLAGPPLSQENEASKVK